MNRNRALWLGVLGGPLTWLCSFEARFALAPRACTFQSKIALYAVALVALACCALFALVSWRQWKALGEQPPSDRSGALSRATFMAIGGIALSAACFLIVLAQAIPEVVLGACQ